MYWAVYVHMVVCMAVFCHRKKYFHDRRIWAAYVHMVVCMVVFATRREIFS